MKSNRRRIVIIGSGIAGLSAAIYALRCGYDVDVLEMNGMAGGLATSWRRGPYTFETCLHWFLGSNPHGEFHRHWQELFDMGRLRFINLHEFVRLETEDGESLRIYTNADMLEAELLRRAPEDINAIRDFVHTVRTLGKFHLVDPSEDAPQKWFNMLRDLPVFPQLMKLSKMSGEEYGSRFSDPLLRSFFSAGDLGKLSALAMLFSLAWMNERNAGYCIGGSQAIIRLMTEKIADLGGKLTFNAKVDKILVENDAAVGVQLAGGEAIGADWIISAADGHTTIFDLLQGKYIDESIRRTYQERRTFASYLQVSLGIGADLSTLPPLLTRILDSPISIDPGTELSHIPFRFFHYDPTFAPPHKIAVTSTLPTRNFQYWIDLRQNDPDRYHAEKDRVAQAVISVLDKRIPGVRQMIEVVDVATPASILRYTGNWKASQEGWLIEPGQGLKPLPKTLPGLRQFMMIGQWTMPGGGLPSGPMTARPAIRAICRHDHVPFHVESNLVADAAHAAV